MSDYTPTTEEVRADYVRDHTHGYDEYQGDRTLTAVQGDHEAEFDRWLAQHDAEVRTAALNAAADALPESTPPLGGPLAISPAVHARFQEWLRAQAGGAA